MNHLIEPDVSRETSFTELLAKANESVQTLTDFRRRSVPRFDAPGFEKPLDPSLPRDLDHKPPRAAAAIAADIEAYKASIAELELQLIAQREALEEAKRELAASLDEIDRHTTELRKQYLAPAAERAFTPVLTQQADSKPPATPVEQTLPANPPPCHPAAMWVWEAGSMVCSECKTSWSASNAQALGSSVLPGAPRDSAGEALQPDK